MASMLLRRTTAISVLLCLSTLALVGCAKSSPTAPPNPPDTAATDASGNPILSGSPPAVTPAPPVPPTYPTTVEAYAKAAVKAWAENDATRLGQLEPSDGVLHTLWGCAGCYDIHFALVNCDGTAGSSYCLFFNNVGDELTVRISHALLGQPLAVISGGFFDQITFPSDNKAYAQEALNAWLNRNDARLKLLTQANLTSAQVDALGPNRNVTWTYDHSEGAAGSLYYEWHDPAGHALAFRFINGPPAPSTGTASHHRIVDIIYLP